MAPPSRVLLALLLLGPGGIHAFFTPASPFPRHGGAEQQQQRPLPLPLLPPLPPLRAELMQMEVRQATKADFGAIAQARNAVIFVPQGAAAAGRFQLGSQSYAVASEEERLILSRIPYLVAGQAVAFLVEGWAANTSSGRGSRAAARRVVAATVDVFVREEEGPSLPRRVFIKNMIVDPAFRRQGHARRLLARVAAYALEVGAEEVHLEVLCRNGEAMALYESEGFELLREPFNLLARALGVGKVTMRKRVAADENARGGGGGGAGAAAGRGA